MSEPYYSIFGLCLDLYTVPNTSYSSVYRRKCASDQSLDTSDGTDNTFAWQFDDTLAAYITLPDPESTLDCFWVGIYWQMRRSALYGTEYEWIPMYRFFLQSEEEATTETVLTDEEAA